MTEMYKIRPIFEVDQKIPLSTCMYEMKNLHKQEQNINNEHEALSKKINILDQVKRALKKSLPDVIELEQQQEDILKKLSMLKKQIETFRQLLNEPIQRKQVTPNIMTQLPLGVKVQDLVVYASPSNPPYGILALQKIWGSAAVFTVASHTHSSIQVSSVPQTVFKAFDQSIVNKQPRLFHVSLIWKQVGRHLQAVMSPTQHIVLEGEVTLLRLLSHLGPNHLSLESYSAEQASAADWVLDLAYKLADGSTPERQLKASLAKLEANSWLIGQSTPTIVDAALWSYFKSKKALDCPAKLKTWMNNCNKMFL